MKIEEKIEMTVAKQTAINEMRKVDQSNGKALSS